MGDFRFSVNVLGLPAPGEFAELCRRVERHGYDVLFAADHLGMPSPFPVLVAAAQATERLRVGTLVLNAPFWNPALLARDVATTDVLTGGRLEVGLGSGHMKWEFDEAGIAWQGFSGRAERLEETVTELGRRFAADGFAQQERMREAYGMPVLRPVQRTGFGGWGPPLIVGGTGDRILRIAARHADVVSVAGAYQIKGRPPGSFRIGSAAETEERVAFVRACAGERAGDLELHVLVQMVLVTDDRAGAAEEVVSRFGPAMTVEELLEAPHVLIGSVDEIAGQIHRNRDRFGFTHYTVHGPYTDVFAPVIEAVHRAAG
ncbi:TIGR03621 family F420-dependent LLM class oxidoreductase [Streptomyces sp. NPDC002734]|uniref:TIGR03621 family F420-dependent LLM class oxidoreductase n=1 Tax=Streptomyces sp. NPDC002734 TaxID=3154426 RepID=UPI00332B3FB1